MTFGGNGPLDTSGVSGGGSGGGFGGNRGGRVAIGGGAGLVITVVALLFGINPGDILGSDSSSSHSTSGGSSASTIDQHIKSCTLEKANSDTICRVVATTNSLNAVWPQLINGYTRPKTTIFSSGVNTNGCGSASSAVGPFYCPADSTAYFDPGFFDTLANKLGGSNGPLAQEYVVAHEFGHHVQNLLGTNARAQRLGSRGATSGSVRLELQADCYAGVWAEHADKGPKAMLEPITRDQINDVITTAKAIGDDTLSGKNDTEGWTHGSSAQRVRWFSAGYQSGKPTDCDTFSARSL